MRKILQIILCFILFVSLGCSKKELSLEDYKNIVTLFADSFASESKMTEFTDKYIDMKGFLAINSSKSDTRKYLEQYKKLTIDNELESKFKNYVVSLAKENEGNGFQVRITDFGQLKTDTNNSYIHTLIVGIRSKNNSSDWKIEEIDFIFYKDKIINILIGDDKISLFNDALDGYFFQMNKKYYQVGNEYDYSMTFKEDGKIEYHVIEHKETFCDDIGCSLDGQFEENDPSCCDEYTINDETYTYSTENNFYKLDGNKIIITAKEGEFYQGWYYSYDECLILPNGLKCDNYNAYHGNEPLYAYTEYYELRD